MKERIIVGSVVGVIGAVVAIGARSSNRTKLEREARFESHELVASCDAYASERDYVESIFADAHAEAFDDNFVVPGRYSRGRLERPEYQEEVFALMIGRAHSEKHDKVAESLEKQWFKGHPRPRGK